MRDLLWEREFLTGSSVLLHLCIWSRGALPWIRLALCAPSVHWSRADTSLPLTVESYSGLLAARFFLGLTEAGVFPGCFYLLSMWYTRREALKRFAIFFNSVTLAGAFGSLIASGIQNMSGTRGKAGWRWIFILEGLGTMVIAMTMWFLLMDFPEDAKWLSPEERAFMKARLVVDKEDDSKPQPDTTLKGFTAFFSDYKVFFGALLYFGEFALLRESFVANSQY